MMLIARLRYTGNYKPNHVNKVKLQPKQIGFTKASLIKFFQNMTEGEQQEYICGKLRNQVNLFYQPKY